MLIELKRLLDSEFINFLYNNPDTEERIKDRKRIEEINNELLIEKIKNKADEKRSNREK